MAIPHYQEFMLPVLRAVSDGQEYEYNEITEKVAEAECISQIDREETFKKGGKKFDYCVRFAVLDLKEFGLIENISNKRPVKMRITENGGGLLDRNLDRNIEKLDKKYLKTHFKKITITANYEDDKITKDEEAILCKTKQDKRAEWESKLKDDLLNKLQ